MWRSNLLFQDSIVKLKIGQYLTRAEKIFLCLHSINLNLILPSNCSFGGGR
jgi:hypothetical protein